MKLSSKLFSYRAATKTFTAEISELPKNFDGNPFYIRSAKTGTSKLFLFEGVDTDGEDIAGWRFICPGEGFRALVIND